MAFALAHAGFFLAEAVVPLPFPRNPKQLNCKLRPNDGTVERMRELHKQVVGGGLHEKLELGNDEFAKDVY